MSYTAHDCILTSTWLVDLWRGGRHVTHRRIDNVLTKGWVREAAKRRTGQTAARPTHHAVGTGTAIPAYGDTAMGQQRGGRKAFFRRDVVGTQQRVATVWYPTDISDLTWELSEFGIWTAATGGTLMARVITDAPITLTADSVMTIQTHVTRRNGGAGA